MTGWIGLALDIPGVIPTGMRLSRAHLLILASVVLLCACSRPGEKRCVDVCEHYLDLYLSDKYDEQIKAATTDTQRVELEQQRTADRKERRDNPQLGFEACKNRCNRRSRVSVADCVMDAETLAEANECDEEGCSVTVASGRTSPNSVWLLLGAILSMALWRRRRR